MNKNYFYKLDKNGFKRNCCYIKDDDIPLALLKTSNKRVKLINTSEIAINRFQQELWTETWQERERRHEKIKRREYNIMNKN